MVESVVHQKDVQARGGVCSRYPVSCLIKDLLCGAGVACGPDYRGLKVLDLTFGEGRFWKAFDGLFRPYIVGIDIRKLKWHVRPDMFYRDEAWDWRVHVYRPIWRADLVVADPPWSPYRRGNDRRKHYDMHSMVGTPLGILRAGLAAAKHFRCPLLVHYKERWVPDGTRVLTETWFQGGAAIVAMGYVMLFVCA